MELLLGAIACGLFLIYLKLDDIVDQLKNKDMKDCTTCKYGFEDERLGIPMCHHPLRFSEDCVDFNMHEEKKEPKKATGIVEKKLSDELEEAAENIYKTPFGTRAEDFIAGAEWMARQGYSQEETVEDKALELGYESLSGITPIINLPDSFKPGDKVIVQIRKK